MFQFPALALFRVISLQDIRLSHSEISGLSIVCIYPELIAAYHVLHRLLVPRHPPCALIRFKYCWYYLPRLVFIVMPRGHNLMYYYIDNKNCFPNMSKIFFNVQMQKSANMQLNLWCVWTWTKWLPLQITSLIITAPLSMFTFSHLLICTLRKKWRISESNRWPPACKAGALASWANPPFVMCKFENLQMCKWLQDLPV